jgi:hypothetical protein
MVVLWDVLVMSMMVKQSSVQAEMDRITIASGIKVQTKLNFLRPNNASIEDGFGGQGFIKVSVKVWGLRPKLRKTYKPQGK